MVTALHCLSLCFFLTRSTESNTNFQKNDVNLCNFLLCPLSQNGMGWVSMMARLGAMVAPMVLLLGEDFPWLPGFIYGGAPILSGIFAFFLPETLAQPLPDTIQDVDDR